MEKQYTAPLLTVVAVNVERGYAATMGYPLPLSKTGNTMEDRTESSNWTFDNDENFWENTF